MSSLSSLFRQHRALVLLDTETSGLDPDHDQIIELAAVRLELAPTGALRVAQQMDTFIRLPEGEVLPEKIIQLTGITDADLKAEGVTDSKAASQFYHMLKDGPVLLAAYNAQFDLLFIRGLLRGLTFKADFLDVMTVFKDRRPFPHKLANAIEAYGLEEKVRNSHRAIDDVLAMFEVMKAMEDERADLASYINIFGTHPRYGRSGGCIKGVRYYMQPYRNAMATPAQTLPAQFWRHCKGGRK